MKQSQPHTRMMDRRAQPRILPQDLSKIVPATSKQESERLSMQLLANYQAARQTRSL